MRSIPIYKAKAILSELIREAEAGVEIVITRDDAPVVILKPVTQKENGRKFGAMKGRASAGTSFFDPLDSSELKLWEGEK